VNYESVLSQGSSLQVVKDHAGFAADWKLDTVEVKEAGSKQHVTFPFYGWLSKKAGLQHTLHPAGADEVAARRAVTQYSVEVITSDKRGAGTDAEVGTCPRARACFASEVQ
jgi:lipoxygenase homology domain-containing protein 1